MRYVLAGALSAAMGLTSFAYGQQPHWPQPGYEPASPQASLGRPIPAAALGRPMAAGQSAAFTPVQPAAFQPVAPQPAGFRPFIPSSRVGDSAPMLAPIYAGTVMDGAPMPLPPGGGPMSVTPPGANFTPLHAPTPLNQPMMVPAPGCAGCGMPASPDGFMYGDPGCCTPGFPMMGGMGAYDSRLYASAEFLLWWVPTISTPLPLALASAQPYTGGALPPSQVAIGSTNLISSTRIGGRFGLGFWLDPCGRHGFDASFFFSGPMSRDISATTTVGLPTLLRPFIVINTPVAGGNPAPPGRPNFADIVGNPGRVDVRTESFFLGADASYRRRLMSMCGGSLDFLFGFRYLYLNEFLRITEAGTNDDGLGNLITGTLTDNFRTVNHFYGGQLGLKYERHWGPWSVALTGKAALGSNAQMVQISGSAAFSTGDVFTRGLFAQPSNIGTFWSFKTAMVNELGLTIGYDWTPWTRIHIGYSALYWSNVLRPGDQIDPIIDETLVPKPGNPAPVFEPLHPSDPHPVIPFKRSDWWAHGLNFGITFKW